MVARRRPKSLVWSALALAVALPFACVPPTAVPDNEALTPPFAVSDYFSPTGYEGDGATVGVVNMVAAACTSVGTAPNSVGDCYEVTYTPPAPSPNGYAGVYWQYPGNNWGAYPGHTIHPGATQATVWARGASGGEQVTFKVGGIPGDSIEVTGPTVTLTTQWQKYSVPFDGSTYSEVLGGFAWVVTLTPADGGPPDTQPIVFYLDSIQWSP
jgi:hypothetical protein